MLNSKELKKLKCQKMKIEKEDTDIRKIIDKPIKINGQTVILKFVTSDWITKNKCHICDLCEMEESYYIYNETTKEKFSCCTINKYTDLTIINAKNPKKKFELELKTLERKFVIVKRSNTRYGY